MGQPEDFSTRIDKAHIDGIVVAKSVDGEVVGSGAKGGLDLVGTGLVEDVWEQSEASEVW